MDCGRRIDHGSTLAQIAIKVPWQFAILLPGQNFRFIKKEVPALPTKQVVRLANQDMNITSVIGQQLAVNWYLTRFSGTSQLATVTNDNIQELAKSFIDQDGISWRNVAVVYSTTPFTVETSDHIAGGYSH